MLEKMIIAGFGGQGVMFFGKLLCYTMMLEDKNVTYIPSYGAEMRGGTANCHVILSSKEIASPMVEKGTTVIVLNQPSYEKFKNRVLKGGTLLVNSSLVNVTDPPDGIRIYQIPATQLAADLGDVRLANMVVLGAFTYLTGILSRDKLYENLRMFLTGKKAAMLEINRKAIDRGYEVIEKGK